MEHGRINELRSTLNSHIFQEYAGVYLNFGKKVVVRKMAFFNIIAETRKHV